MALFTMIASGNKEYNVMLIDASTQFSAASPKYHELKSSAISPTLYDYLPSIAFMTSTNLYSCNEDPSGDVSITRIGRSTLIAKI